MPLVDYFDWNGSCCTVPPSKNYSESLWKWTNWCYSEADSRNVIFTGKEVYSVRKTRRAPSLLLLLNQFQKHLNLCSSLDRIYILANQRREIPVLLEAVLLWWKNYMTLILLCLYVKKMGGYLSFRVPSEYEKRWLRSAQFRLKHVKLTIPNPFKESSP